MGRMPGWAVGVKVLDSCPTLAFRSFQVPLVGPGFLLLAFEAFGGPCQEYLSPRVPASWLLAPSTVSLSSAPAGSQGPGPCRPVISGSHHLRLASVILGTASHLHHCGPGHHPSIICLISIILTSGLPLAARALYMVGFHSFVCTFGEGLLCARPCARRQVNGHCPWECTPRGDAREPADGREPGPGQRGRGAEKRESDRGGGQGAEGSAEGLLSGVWKERSHVLSFFPAGG